tara:strand:- start:2219 stop:2419 length:201 start_codon:yes stop_codon:yes gene_type:complete
MNRLDLHGVKHEDVDRLVENFVLLHDPPMRIITGNSDMMTKLVLKVLKRHNIGYEKFAPSHITILR